MNCDSIDAENDPPAGGAVVVVVAGTVVVVWGTVVVVGATVVVVGGLVVGGFVVVVGAGTVDGGATKRVVVVVELLVEVLVDGGRETVVVGDGAVVEVGGPSSSSVNAWMVTSPENATVEVVVASSAMSGLAASCEVEPNWLPMARAVPPMTSMATTIARIVTVRVFMTPPEGCPRIRHFGHFS
jgi:hypothetical protein